MPSDGIIDASSFSTRDTEYMSKMFARCSCLSELDLSSFKTINARKMDSMFYSCTNLIELDLTGFETNIQAH